MSDSVRFICVDLQNEFSCPGGACFIERPSVEFVMNELVPFLEANNIQVAEIISDYRQPRPGDERDCCRPGEWGYESLLPSSIRKDDLWIKCMNSPVWTRKGIGDPAVIPGVPFPDPEGFGTWLTDQVGTRDDQGPVVLFGLTADCCVLAVVQELRWRGFNVKVLSEATDVRSGISEEKRRFLTSPPFTYWGSSISWEELKRFL